MKPRKDQSSSVDTAAVHPFARNAVLPFPEPDPVLSTLHAKANGPARPSLLSSKANEGTDGQLSFLQAFGVLGLPMVFVVAVCITWTSWLLFLACAPTWTANHLMNTSAFEDGNFWLLIHPAQWLQVLSLIGLALVLLGYTYVLFKMLLWRNHVSSFSESFRQRIESSEHWTKIIVCRLCRWRLGRVLALWRDLTGFSGTKRKFWVRDSNLVRLSCAHERQCIACVCDSQLHLHVAILEPLAQDRRLDAPVDRARPDAPDRVPHEHGVQLRRTHCLERALVRRDDREPQTIGVPRSPR